MTVTGQQIAAYALNTIAVLLQLVGALLVALDIRDAQRNTAKFKHDLDNAEVIRQEHIESLDKPFAVIPGDWMAGRKRREIKYPEEYRETIANQLGPAAAEQREALIAYVNAQNERSGTRLWLGVGLVVAGALIAYAAVITI